MVDLNQGNRRPRWTFSFRSEKERKRASFLKKCESALLDPENLEKHRARATNQTLAVLTTFSEKFLKIFSRKNMFCVSSLFPREKVDSGGSESTKRVCDEKEHLFAPFRSEMKMSVWAYDFPGSNRPKVLKRALGHFRTGFFRKYPSGDFSDLSRQVVPGWARPLPA